MAPNRRGPPPYRYSDVPYFAASYIYNRRAAVPPKYGKGNGVMHPPTAYVEKF